MAEPAAPSEPLSLVDAAWLGMDKPTNLMMVCGLMMFAGRLDPAAFKALLHERMLCFHRFRQRVVRDAPMPRWERDPAFDIDAHVVHVALPAPGGDAELEDLASELASTALDPQRPMWQFHVVDRGDGRSALVMRVHHCYGDGFALMHVMLTMTDATATAGHLHPADIGQPADPRAAWERILGVAGAAAGGALRAAGALAGQVAGWAVHPLRAVDSAEQVLGVTGELAVIAAMTPDAPTRLKGPLGVMKRIAWADPVPLAEVQAVAAALGCTVNDVLISCVCGALRGYLLEQGDDAAVEVRALVPVNLRPPGPVQSLGNRFGLVFLGLPVGEADAVARTLDVHRRMRELMQSQQASAALAILATMAVLPPALRERITESLAANASVIITNVRGPAQPRYLAGAAIERELFWVPQAGGIGMGVSILSYAGQVYFGLVTDRLRIPEPRQLARRIVHEFNSLLLSCLLLLCPGDTSRSGK